ncbi:MAG: hypothetical protein M3Y82_05160 [Verrucomicrobiota bacterium]|nr:hypothetical protein [Verrucomicrobiota bacterium]
MKAPLKTKFGFAIESNLPEATKLELLNDPEPRYIFVNFEKPHRQDGKDFFHVVAPVKLTSGNKLVQAGAGVLCQTEAEVKETLDSLTARNKKHLVTFQVAGIGGVAWLKNLRRITNEIGVLHKILPSGKKLWLAFEREIDKDTLEVEVIRRKETKTEGEADFLAKGWLGEYNQKKKAHFDAIGKSPTPLPPVHCSPLTKSDIEDFGKAKMLALRKQWPHCFQIFEQQKANPNSKIPDQQIEDAYLLDLVGNGSDPSLKTVDGGKVRADMQLISALHKATQNYAKRGKNKIIDSAIYLIAFNWELGWCYLSNEQLADKLTQLLETPFTPEQVEKYRYRTLGLVAKHLPGPPSKSP